MNPLLRLALLVAFTAFASIAGILFADKLRFAATYGPRPQPVPRNLARLWSMYPDPGNVLWGLIGATAVRLLGILGGPLWATIAVLALAFAGVVYAEIFEKVTGRDDPRTGWEAENEFHALLGGVLVVVFALLGGSGFPGYAAGALPFVLWWATRDAFDEAKAAQYRAQRGAR